jgi:hypothetical protein
VERAVRVHSTLRFERVSCCQRVGFVDHNSFEHTDWDAVARNLDSMKDKYGQCIWAQNAEAYAYANYE